MKRASSCHNDDLIELRVALMHAVVPLVSDILHAAPNQRLTNRKTAVWGNKGSFKLELAGKKCGLWFDHEAGEGGDLLKLIQRRVTGNSFPQAVAWARDWLGWPPEGPGPDQSAQDKARKREAERIAQAEASRQQAEAEAALEAQQRVRKAQERWGRAVLIQDGDPADLYLRKTRRIAPVKAWPSAVKFQSGHDPAAIFAATNLDGTVTAVQVITLTLAGEKRPVGSQKTDKWSHGVLKGSAVRLPGPSDRPLLLAEGPETGLSVWAATGYETWVALGGNIASIALPKDRRVILCADDDARSSQSRKKAKKLVRDLKAEGHDVVEAMPWEIHREDKTDFNDVMKFYGPEAVKARISHAIDVGSAKVQLTVPIDEARSRLDRHVGAFFDYVGKGHERPPVHALSVTLGVGKTETALKHATQTLKRLREDGTRDVIVIAVPEHRLSEEVAARFRRMPEAQGLSVAIWRGMDSKVPDAIDDIRMCGNLDEVREAQRVYAKASKEVCPKCPLKAGCHYLMQQEQKADLWIVSHQVLFQKPPDAVNRYGIGALVVDESPWQSGLIGCEGKPITIALDALDPGVMPIPASGGERLEDIRQRLKSAASGAPDGPLCRSSLTAVGFEASTGTSGKAAEWSRKVDKGGFAERQDNVTIGSMALVWRAVEDVFADVGTTSISTGDGRAHRDKPSGWLAVGRGENGERVLIVRGRHSVNKSWHVPTLLIDATMSEDLIKPYWPDVAVIDRIEVATPFMRIHQACGKTFGKSMLSPLPDEGMKARDARQLKARRSKNLRKVEAFFATQTRIFGGKALVVSNRPIIEAMRLPKGIQTAHFNAVAGRDGWGDIRTLFVVGRTQPSPAAVEAMAGALTGVAVTPIAGWYPRADVDRLQMVQEEARRVSGEADRHLDPIAEQCRARIAEGEVMQAIGRGRGVNRHEGSPLDVFVLTDVALPVPVHSFIPDDAIFKPTIEEQQLAMGGIAFEDASAAYEAYPRIWKSAGATREAMRAERNADPSSSVRKWYKDISLPKSDAATLVCVEYKLAGPSRHRASALVDVFRVLDPKAAIETLLGPITYFGEPNINSNEAPATGEGLKPLHVSELPKAEQDEVRCAMAIFHAFAELQAGASQGTADSIQEQARADSATFMRQWQTEAIILGWPAKDLFAAPAPAERGGLVYWLRGEGVRALGPEHAISWYERVFDRLAA